ncbi:aldose epimerase family protein [Maribacter polysaccharolyticus]|uniref:aldose epimerase family protein n=1 Tax=Maribacter polysaccharolyticus TaxID=3020831 RepID=UPI00237F39D4|nr:aldose epimerase family protein [Maribacter polysaccharolyticus]MDE3740859.1 galactose mutarotase [Maribacter polysaccharolyticus]
MAAQKEATLVKRVYGITSDDKSVDLYTLRNKNGMEVDIITYGGRITRISVPDNNGDFNNVVLGFDTLEQYENENPFFGALVGRYGNRIANAEFKLNGTTYTLAANNGPNCLHGGIKGFDRKVWQATEGEKGGGVSLQLSCFSKDMEEGFPGNLTCNVTYTLTEDNALEVAYGAITDKPTVVNLTQHSYFNLSGDFLTPVLQHEVTLDADKLVPVDENLIPTGEFMKVAGTPFDFRSPKAIGKDIDADHGQLEKGGGYDHCWVLNDQDSGLRTVATVSEPKTGRTMEVATTEPGVQLYTGNFLDGTLPIPGGGVYGKRSGFCLETQHYPDSPNRPDFPTTVLNPGENYTTVTSFKFNVK